MINLKVFNYLLNFSQLIWNWKLFSNFWLVSS